MVNKNSRNILLGLLGLVGLLLFGVVSLRVIPQADVTTQNQNKSANIQGYYSVVDVHATDDSAHLEYFVETDDFTRYKLIFPSGDPPSIPSTTRVQVQGVFKDQDTILVDKLSIIENKSSFIPKAKAVFDQSRAQGAKRVGVLVVSFPQNPQKSTAVNDLQNNLFGGAGTNQDWFRQTSNGKLNLTGEVKGPYTINPNGCDLYEWQKEVMRASGTKYTTYDYVVFSFPQTSCYSTPGYGEVEGKYVWLLATNDIYRLYNHEMGHVLGLNHNSCDTNAKITEYCNPANAMGTNLYAGGGHYGAYEDYLLGWGGDVQTASKGGTYTIDAIESNGPTVRIPIQGVSLYYGLGTAQGDYWLEWRGEQQKLLINKAADPHANVTHFSTDAYRALLVKSLAPGQTFTDTTRQITITPKGSGKSVSVEISFGAGTSPLSRLQNLLPQLSNMILSYSNPECPAKLLYCSTTAAASSEVNQVLNLTNQFRASQNLSQLTLHLGLTQIAQSYSQVLVNNTDPAHYQAGDTEKLHSIDGTSLDQRLASLALSRDPQGRIANAHGENVGVGYPDAPSIMTAWRNSPGHLANLAFKGYTHIGIGYAFQPGTRYGTAWVQDFLELRSGDTPGNTNTVPPPPVQYPSTQQPPTTTAPPTNQLNQADLGNQVVTLINNSRTQRTLPAFRVSPNLTQAAQLHANDMASYRYYSTSFRDGRTIQQVAQTLGYQSTAIGESISMDVPTPQAVFNALLNSGNSNDRANLYSQTFVDIGVGVVTNYPSSTPVTVNGTRYPGQNFYVIVYGGGKGAGSLIDLPPSNTNTNPAAPPPNTNQPPSQTTVSSNLQAQKLFEAINNYRKAQNPPLALLSYNTQLTQSAQTYVERMAREKFFSTTSSDGSTPQRRAQTVGYTSTVPIGENIAGAISDPTAVLNAWLQKSESSNNIRSGAYTEIGIGFILAPGSPYGYYWVADFGTRTNAPSNYVSYPGNTTIPVNTNNTGSTINTTAPIQPTTTTTTNTQTSQVLFYINSIRRQQGVSDIALEPHLNQAAQGFAGDMAARNYYAMDHKTLEGKDLQNRLQAAGYANAAAWGENIAAGQPTAETVVQAWEGSPTHKANIINPQFNELGVGYGYNANSQWRHYWVTVFGARFTGTSPSTINTTNPVSTPAPANPSATTPGNQNQPATTTPTNNSYSGLTPAQIQCLRYPSLCGNNSPVAPTTTNSTPNQPPANTGTNTVPTPTQPNSVPNFELPTVPSSVGSIDDCILRGINCSQTPVTSNNPSSTTPAPNITTAVPSDPATQTKALFDLINAIRRSRDAAPLTSNPALNKAASDYALTLATQKFFDHTGKDGSTPVSRAVAAGYATSSVIENLAGGYPNAVQVLNAWREQTNLMNNMVSSTVKDVGLGYAYAPTSPLLHYWVVDFSAPGTSPSTPPTNTVQNPGQGISFTFIEPDGVADTITQGQTYTIKYTLTDSNSAARVSFGYDSDRQGYDGFVINSCVNLPAGSNVSCVVATQSLSPGTYYFYASVTNQQTTTRTYSTGPITIVASTSPSNQTNTPTLTPTERVMAAFCARVNYTFKFCDKYRSDPTSTTQPTGINTTESTTPTSGGNNTGGINTTGNTTTTPSNSNSGNTSELLLPIAVNGDATCKAQTSDTLKVLRDKSPSYYQFVVSNIRSIDCLGASSLVGARMYVSEGRMTVSSTVRQRSKTYYAGFLVHEATHQDDYNKGKEYSGKVGETHAFSNQYDALVKIGAPFDEASEAYNSWKLPPLNAG